MLEHKGYRGAVEVDDGAFVGRVAGLRDVVTFEGRTIEEVEQALKSAVFAVAAVQGEERDVDAARVRRARRDERLVRRRRLRSRAGRLFLEGSR